MLNIKSLMRCDAPAFYQRGAALILMMFIFGMAALAYTVKSMNAASMRAEQDVKTMVALGEAKDALIGWSVMHTNTPGQMPWPDRREVTPPANYDGQSDCSSVSFGLLNSLNEPNFLGQIPLITSTTPCQIYNGVGLQPKDSGNNNLWYAVSRNLVRNYVEAKDPTINPGVATSSVYPWLIVRDKNGVVISNRVAVVIIAPGASLDGQNRSSVAPPPSAYLDNFTVGGVEYSNRDYDQDDEDFIMGDTTHPTFNDRLVYITIDELMYALEKRASQEVRQKLRDYYLANSEFPYAAVLGDSNHVCKQGVASGFLPIQPATATCTSNQACDVGFSMTKVQFRSTSAVSYSARVGSCSYSGNVCDCTGGGSCTRVSPSKTFLCTSNGGCLSSEEGEFIFTYIPNLGSPTLYGGCAGGNGNVACNGAGSFSSASASDCTYAKVGLESLPEWFLKNRWQDYIYYARSLTSSLESGGRKEISALLVSTGAPIVDAPFSFKGSPQSRPSNNIADYLDSAENTDGDSVFEATNKQKTHIYNDQVFIVAP